MGLFQASSFERPGMIVTRLSPSFVTVTLYDGLVEIGPARPAPSFTSPPFYHHYALYYVLATAG